MNSRDHIPIETIRISDRDKSKLLSSLRTPGHQEAPPNERRRLRVLLDDSEAVLTILNETGGATPFTVLPRNISRGGIGLVHGRFIYPGMRCEIMLPSIDGRRHSHTGTVRFCRHITGIVHEVGIQFDKTIDITEYVSLTPDEEMQHLQEVANDSPAEENQTVRQLSSRVLLVDDFATDRKLYGLWLSRAGMLATAIADIKTARERVDVERFDLAIVDMRLSGGERGSDLIRSLRNSGFVAPILAVSADNDPQTSTEALTAGANRFMAKPFTSEQLAETTQELMGFSADDPEQSTPIYSDFSGDPDMKPLLNAFARGLGETIVSIREANTRNDYETLENLAHLLKGAGSGYGFSVISEQAGELLAALNDSAGDMDRIKQQASELVCILNRIKLR